MRISDIGVSTMSVIKATRGLKDRLRETKGDIGNLEYKIDVQEQRVKELEQQASANTKELEDKVSENQHIVELREADIADIRTQTEAKMAVLSELLKNDPQNKVKQLNQVLIKMGSKVESLTKKVAFYQDNDVCHACKQDIHQDTKDKYISESNAQLVEFNKAIAEAEKMMGKKNEILAEAKAITDELREWENEVFKKQTEVESRQRSITEAQNKLTEMQMSSGNIDKENGRLSVLQEDLAELKKKALELVVSCDEHEAVAALLKDSGIKTQIVKKYIPVMNKFIRKYLSELDLPLNFVLDEQFNESVSSPLHQDHASFSEGQKGRIDLALLFTWREVCRLKNSVSTNVLFLDEVFSSSLTRLAKSFSHMLRYNVEDTNVIVVDHTCLGPSVISLTGNRSNQDVRFPNITTVTAP